METSTKRRASRSDFFTIMAGVILLLVFAGFVPTLYLRPLFLVAPIPTYLYLHGIILTGWFVWFLAQSMLIRAGRVRSHRKLGAFAAGYGVVVVAASLMASLGSPSRVAASGIDFSADASDLGIGVTGVTVTVFLAGILAINIANVVRFAIFLVAAVVLRRNPEAHKRLMLFASITILGPALARLARLPLFGGEQGPFTPMMLWGLMLAIVVYDIVSRRRLHPATALGAFLFLLFDYGAGVAGGTEAVQTMVLRLR